MTDQSAHCATAAEVQATGRDETSENFPVGSWLLPRETRPDVLAFYRFARAADNIADSATLTSDQKVAELDRMLAIFDGAASVTHAEQAAARHKESLAKTGVTDLHARQILQAFRRDAVNPRCRTWNDLMLYCRYSAVPVGRFMIDLHGEDKDAYPASDALCAVLQVLNHLQDCGDDFTSMDRIYLPLDWIDAEGADVEDLRAPSLSPGMRHVLDRCLDRVDTLMVEAATLPRCLTRSRLRHEAAVIAEVARTLTKLLRRRDPLAGRVALSKWQRFMCVAHGIAKAMRSP